MHAGVTENISLYNIISNVSEPCLHPPMCVEVPALSNDYDQTLILALPFLPAVTGLEEDLLCTVHSLPGERCVDLLSCNRFRESVYADSISICRAMNGDSNLEMCFHNNIADEMNETRLHFFYSNLHCHPYGARLPPESTRLYSKSVQLHVTKSECLNYYVCIMALLSLLLL